ncbi:hypothetical protein DESC_260043 [Desulfosarcina cetonica]|nr:hypothetical protein DESC_260043 [Desulfosarcina cetonica]
MGVFTEKHQLGNQIDGAVNAVLELDQVAQRIVLSLDKTAVEASLFNQIKHCATRVEQGPAVVIGSVGGLDAPAVHQRVQIGQADSENTGQRLQEINAGVEDQLWRGQPQLSIAGVGEKKFEAAFILDRIDDNGMMGDVFQDVGLFSPHENT